MFDPATAYDLFAVDGNYESIHVLADDGTDVDQLRADIVAATPGAPVEAASHLASTAAEEPR